ncbi:MAG: hypothetical protein ACLVL7_02290 [Anaerotruncus massiliensis (ex Togo et al. 2019)]
MAESSTWPDAPALGCGSRQQQTAQRQMGPQQMSRPSGRPADEPGTAQNGNRPKGILGTC